MTARCSDTSVLGSGPAARRSGPRGPWTARAQGWPRPARGRPGLYVVVTDDLDEMRRALAEYERQAAGAERR